jgi:cysteine desulfurase
MTDGARAYLDHASTAPMRPAVFDAMVPYLRDHFADPGRIHQEGLATRVPVEVARERVAARVGARPREVVFTSSGTEALNAAVFGALTRRPASTHAVVSAVEHSAVRDCAQRYASEITTVDVDRCGRVSVDDVVAALRSDTALVAVQHANHEVGTRQPVDEIAAAIADHDALLFVDACASFGRLPLNFRGSRIDLMAITAHKVGGPKGVGAMVVRRGLRVPPLLLGGAQERARRSGLENVPAIIGFGVLCDAIDIEREAADQRELTERLVAACAELEGIVQFGDPRPSHSLPHLLCVGVEGIEAEPILLGLDQRGIAAHSGSSCSSEVLEPSPVLAAMGVDAQHSLRFSVGWSSRPEDVARLTAMLPEVVARLRELRT